MDLHIPLGQFSELKRKGNKKTHEEQRRQMLAGSSKLGMLLFLVEKIATLMWNVSTHKVSHMRARKRH
jgi:hypothetical protein